MNFWRICMTGVNVPNKVGLKYCSVFLCNCVLIVKSTPNSAISFNGMDDIEKGLPSAQAFFCIKSTQILYNVALWIFNDFIKR